MVSNRWVIPKKLVGKAWEPIKNVEAVTSKKWGYNGAVMRMKMVFDRKKDAEGKKVWTTQIARRFYPKKDPKYLIVFLHCTRGYGFSRSM
jgi:hypothetical protein